MDSPIDGQNVVPNTSFPSTSERNTALERVEGQMDVVTHALNPRPWDAEAKAGGFLLIQGDHGLA